jgi:hypothetical protein
MVVSVFAVVYARDAGFEYYASAVTTDSIVVTLFDSAAGDNHTRRWKFGDGTDTVFTRRVPSFQHVYHDTGAYMCTLIVYRSGGDTAAADTLRRRIVFDAPDKSGTTPDKDTGHTRGMFRRFNSIFRFPWW